MIYLDCAATSLQKPRAVAQAVAHAMQTMSSPGRGAYPAAMLASDTVYSCREALAELLHVPEPESIVFTMNATHALNIAIGSLVRPGDRVVVSGYEHNAVMRPLYLRGARITVAQSPLFSPAEAVEAFRRALPGAQAAVCTHVSNVFGYVLPIGRISTLCRKFGVPLIVDASQSAGVIPVNFAESGAAFMAMPGHKGLLGPQGTGVLLCAEPGEPLLAGGTGSLSEQEQMPDWLPDRHEAGTHNTAGIAGLLEGVRYLNRRGVERVAAQEHRLLRQLTSALESTPGLELFVSPDAQLQTGVLSLRSAGHDCERVAQALGEAGVAVRAGLHCAPLAHRSAHTLETGTVRLSVSPFNRPDEIRTAAACLKEILKKL